jgi:hypothetical protein
VARTARKERRRSGGEGSVYETAEGWRGALTWTDDEGVRHRRVVRGSTSQAARDKLDDLRRELKLGTITPAGTGTVAEEIRSDWMVRQGAAMSLGPSAWVATLGDVADGSLDAVLRPVARGQTPRSLRALLQPPRRLTPAPVGSRAWLELLAAGGGETANGALAP